MRHLYNSEINQVHGGRIKVGGPAYVSTVAPPSEDIHISIAFDGSKFSYDGKADDFADGWQNFKNDLKSAGWDGLEALSLVEAGVACDLHFTDVCKTAQGQVEFTDKQSEKYSK